MWFLESAKVAQLVRAGLGCLEFLCQVLGSSLFIKKLDNLKSMLSLENDHELVNLIRD